MSDDRLPVDHPHWGWEFRVENFVHDRLVEEAAAAAALPAGPPQDAALARLDALREILLGHSIYIYSDGTNSGRCYTCDPLHGVPCLTVISLARLWLHHPDLPPAAKPPAAAQESEWQRALRVAGTYRRRHESGLDDRPAEPAS